ncbi:hypothetical protein ACU61A_37265 [Pseudonocardia sichuanensis]|nr:hypothetical protein [Pseudonocardia kunmingensis]
MVGVLFAASTLAGCSIGDPVSPIPPPGPSSDAAPSPVPESPGVESESDADRASRDGLAAYEAMWQDFAEAGLTSNWQSPELGRHATGIALTNLSRGLYADSYNGLVTRGEPLLDPRVTSVEPVDDPTTVRVADCGDSSNWLKYRVDSGARANDSPGGRRMITAVVERQSDGSWKVSDYAVRDLGSC